MLKQYRWKTKLTGVGTTHIVTEQDDSVYIKRNIPRGTVSDIVAAHNRALEAIENQLIKERCN